MRGVASKRIIFGKTGLCALFLLALTGCESNAAAAAPPSPGSATAEAAKPAIPAAVVQEVMLVGTPSLLRVENPWWPWNSPEMPCATFQVFALPSVAEVQLYATGLGRTLLAEASREGECPPANSLQPRISLSKRNPTDPAIARLIALQVDTNPLSTAGAAMQGSIVALAANKKIAEAPLKVERSPRSELFTAITWVFSILIPGLLTYWFTQRSAKNTARRSAQDEFRTFRLGNMRKIREYLDVVRTILGVEQDHPGEQVLKTAAERDLFAKMPAQESAPLYEACSRDDMAGVVAALKVLFPELKTQHAELEAALEEWKSKKLPKHQQEAACAEPAHDI
jgi:hypothetical protein